ncbi:hypothetical protein [Emticicia sp. SJ17W-69]|uniref:hypothetical protein n=1 Tax=Emticicia sp. SJ17W-69 TaxID=3421657 RepID=UPI003EBEC53C
MPFFSLPSALADGKKKIIILNSLQFWLNPTHVNSIHPSAKAGDNEVYISKKKHLFVRLFLFFLSIFLISCQKETPPKEVTRGIYYWKSVYKLSSEELQMLDSCHIKKLYIKAYDLDWDFTKKQAIPKASLHFDQALPKNLELVPTIFITNQTLKQTTDNQIDTLAYFIKKHLIIVWKGMPFSEIQFDCDWTIATQRKYFKLLTSLRKHFPEKQLSATIRLHQIKFAHKTGIPPVDRGMLMFYNMSDWKKPQIQNSIYDLDAASQYLATLEQYPMPLDVVFPIFRWSVFYRNKRFLTVINNLDSQALSSKNFLQKSDNRYTVLLDTTAFGLSLRKGDLIRAEEVNFDEILKGSKALSKKISNQKLTFALYHLDPNTLSFYGYEKLNQIYASFK